MRIILSVLVFAAMTVSAGAGEYDPDLMLEGLKRFPHALRVAPISAVEIGAEDRSKLYGPIKGPVYAKVLRIINGDTIAVEARPWPDVIIRTSVQLSDIDAPETLGFRCDKERELGIRARDTLRIMAGPVVQLYDVRFGKYGGGMVAHVKRGDFEIAEALISRGLAIPVDKKGGFGFGILEPKPEVVIWCK